MKRYKKLIGVICAVVCLVLMCCVSILAVDTETAVDEPIEPVTAVETTTEEFTPPDSGTLEGVCFTFLTFFFSAETVHTYGEFFGKLTIIFVIAIVAWLFSLIVRMFKKRR